MKPKLSVIITSVMLLLIAGILFSGVGTVMTVYNTVVKSKVRVEEALGNLDSVYQRRYALVDNLVEIVKETKGFEKYQIEVEQTIYKQVAEAKAQATKLDIQLPDEVAQRIGRETKLNNMILQTLDKLLVLAQHYPTITDPVIKDRTATFTALKDLKASLQELEDSVQSQRQSLNASVRSYNQNIQIFPANVLAPKWGFTKLAGFEVQSLDARQDVRIKF